MGPEHDSDPLVRPRDDASADKPDAERPGTEPARERTPGGESAGRAGPVDEPVGGDTPVDDPVRAGAPVDESPRAGAPAAGPAPVQPRAEAAQPGAEPAQPMAEPAQPTTARRGRRTSPNMLPARDQRGIFERTFVRLIATGGIVGIGVAIAAIMTSSNSQGWLIGLIVSVVSVVLAALLWSSRVL